MAKIDHISYGGMNYEIAPAAGDLRDIVAPEFSDQSTYTAGSYVLKNGVLYRFTANHTGAWTGSDAEVVTVGGELTGLKADLNDTIELVKSKNLYNPDTVESGYVNNTNGMIVSSQTSSHSDFIPVSGVFTISIGSLLNSGFRYAIYNSQKAYITGENLPSFRTAESGRLYLTVSNANAAYLRFSDKNDLMTRKWQVENGEESTSYEAYYDYIKLKDTVSVEIGQVNNLENRLGALENTAEVVTDLEEDVTGLAASMEAIAKTEEYIDYITDIYTGPYTSGCIPPTGAPTSSSTFWHTEKISVQPGDVLYGKTTDGTLNVYFRFVCAYSGETVVQSAGNSLDYPSYTVPDGIDGVVVSQRAVATGKTRCVEIKRIRNKTATNIKKNAMGYMRAFGNMANGDELHVSENNVKNNVCVAFTANVTAFSKLYIGQRSASGWHSCYLEIDATNLTIHTDQGDVVNAHGLSIGSDIQVFIETENEIKTKKIAIYSDGYAYIDTAARRWICNKGYAAALSDGSVLTDCVLAWTSRNINNPIWIFGDSYVSLYDVRWVYWMIQDGFTMPMINGFAGENSAQAMIALKNLLECRKPQYILWALGMNDGDTVSAVNASWKNNFDIVVGICKKYAITPIFATVPSVQTVNNSFKNTIVRESGYRYIDFAKAVDPDEDGNWIAGALSEDGVHPSVTGAKILYMRALVDFPELMSK